MKLLLIGDERKTRRMVAWGFATDPYRVKTASSRSRVEELLLAESFSGVCIDWRMHEDDAPAIVQALRARLPELPIVAIVSEAEQALSADLKQLGVAEHIVSPFPIEQLHELMRRVALAEPIMVKPPKLATTRSTSTVGGVLPRIMAGDESARRTIELASRAAKSNAAILILGETGTGKSLLAQWIHENSLLRTHSFITVNCPCLNHELLESDLFGHVRGSFTGAVQDTWGKVAAADGGTLFLDEIGDLPMSLQPKLLRLLQEKQYERVGEATPRNANVRIIAATNRDLKREVAAGRFREDLYYRLNVIAIDVPPLRSRPAQIVGAAQGFLDLVCAQIGKPSPIFSAEVRRMLETYPWPGNLREIRNVVERAAILSSGPVLEVGDFPALAAPAPVVRYQVGARVSLQALENAHIQMVVAKSSSLEEAARILEIDKSTLYRKRKQMSSQVTVFDPPMGVDVNSAVELGSR